MYITCFDHSHTSFPTSYSSCTAPPTNSFMSFLIFLIYFQSTKNSAAHIHVSVGLSTGALAASRGQTAGGN